MLYQDLSPLSAKNQPLNYILVWILNSANWEFVKINANMPNEGLNQTNLKKPPAYGSIPPIAKIWNIGEAIQQHTQID